MSTRDNGGPAFPLEFKYGNGTAERANGMSLRDWFAGKALEGLLANPGGPFQANPQSGWGIVNCTVDDLPITAYALADAMLKVRAV